VIWHQADLLDPDQTERLLKTIRPTHLLHFAWYVEHGKFWHAPENLDWVKASLHLVQKFAENGGKRVVVAGTLSEYGEPDEEFVSEIAPLEPQTLYAAAKAGLFLTLDKYAKVADISFAWGRVFFLFGKRESQKRLVPSVIRSLLEGDTAKTSHGNQIRDFLSSDEAARAYVALLDSEVQGAVNIASGEEQTIKKLVLQIAALVGNGENIEFGAIAASPDEPKRLVADVGRLKNEVGWNPRKTLAEQLEDTINWWKKEING
jgi:nucleoside-diphosphate-sugar epimerase